ncbi:hypothetical protein PGT21_004174 [Puccinia graminis f. sp. tritici]|uniref:Uncharacterized protein n=1 Tax=Puccinia graminis f. sp. tritici TaxID=56615 RepID=A0A5B0P8N7_PUCGR|nr:hypothetical protein PGT21_004174 [Puccinia graminis f. sp. tritici]KAA1134287.1 hypothetical protein PGTUg99_034621 [Puccinia graminis f. sp. tritici]
MNPYQVYLFLSLAIYPGAFSLLTGFDPKNLPYQSDGAAGQTGYNQCGNKADKNSQCQNLYINSAEDFCVFAPPRVLPVGEAERIAVAYCSKYGHGTRLIPPGTFKTLHYVRTPHYIQITSIGDFTKLNVPANDEGGELGRFPQLPILLLRLGGEVADNLPSSNFRSFRVRTSSSTVDNFSSLNHLPFHSPDGHGNPVGGLVFGERGQFNHWTEFLSYNELSIRACFNTDQAYRYCEHIYDLEGSRWNMPGEYDTPGFDQCEGEDVPLPMGEYRRPDGSIYKWKRGSSPMPPPGAPGKIKTCKKVRAPGLNYPRSTRR